MTAEDLEERAALDHANTCEVTGPPPQASYEACPHRATHDERARAEPAP
jgi:hypothetical protein